jgi:membrane protease YdiL (CAAX protease family)
MASGISITFVIPYIVLWIAIVLTLFRRIEYSGIASSLSILLALTIGLVELRALLPLTLVAAVTIGAILFHRRNKYAFWILLLATAVVCYGLGTNGFSGFNNPLIVESARITQDAKPFTLYWNYDKACAAYFLILLYQSISSQPPVGLTSIRKSALAFLIIVIVTFTVAYWFGLIRWSPKIPEFLLLWVFSNLFITAAAEEAFFRGLIQHQLQQQLSSIINNGGALSIIIAGTVFGFAHIAMGLSYAIVAIIAGIGYGWIFHLTKRIEASILAHFILNAIHIIFFTYPMIESMKL